MCGLTAIYAYSRDASPVDVAELTTISNFMNARGPDGEGVWISDGKDVGFAHKRLAIIDTSDNGAQPMLLRGESGEVRYAITYNGEIYNFGALRQELLEKGHKFFSTSDTEVLLHLYDRYGESMLGKIRGMYAFAIWDAQRQGIFLARDPFGIKPLYFSDDGSTIRIASQVKALMAGGKISGNSEAAGHVGFFLLGYVPEPYTLYSDIEALPSGTSLWITRDGKTSPHSFFDVREHLAVRKKFSGGPDKIAELKEALLGSVKHHLVSDVPVSIFLSSGLDSATITGLASECDTESLNTMTLQFDELSGGPMDESHFAEKIAFIYGTKHRTRKISKSDFIGELDRLFEAMDQPSIDGVNTYFVAKEAAKVGHKVALSGLGGDELFGGYSSFKQIPSLVRSLRLFPGISQVGSLFRVISGPIFRKFTSSKYASIFEYGNSFGGAYLLRRGLFMPWELSDVMDPEMALEGWKKLELLTKLQETTRGVIDGMAQVSALELLWYMRNQLLRDSDWAGMAHSLEIRTPLVDSQLFETVASLGANKIDMAQTPLHPLPNSILKRPKTGFYLPIREWLMDHSEINNNRRGYRDWAEFVYKRFSS